MSSSRVYKLPVSNIAYHVYNPEEDSARLKAISQRAFQRTLESYHEHERLADLFQVELDKQEADLKEKKEHERLLKQQQQKMRGGKKQRKNVVSKPSSPAPASALSTFAHTHHTHPYHSPGQFLFAVPVDQHHRGSYLERQQPHLGHSRSGSGVSSSSSPIIAAARIVEHQHQTLARHESRIQVYREHSRPGSHLVKNGEGMEGSYHLHSHSHLWDRSRTNSPAIPLTPSPHLSPLTCRQQGVESTRTGQPLEPQQDDGCNIKVESIDSPRSTSVAAATSSVLSPPSRKKRKQAIPVHPSVVARIPGITMRIQAGEEQQLQVEVLRDVSDYDGAVPARVTTTTKFSRSPSMTEAALPTPTASPLAPSMGEVEVAEEEEVSSQSQATQDLEKVKEAIEACRAGYISFMKVPSLKDHGGVGNHQTRDGGPDGGSCAGQDPTQTHGGDVGDRTLDSTSLAHAGLGRRHHQRNKTLSSQDLVLPSTSSPAQDHTFSTLVLKQLGVPLTLENFSSRECVVNNVIGMHDKGFELLEEVVYDAVARQYPHQQLPYHRRRSQSQLAQDQASSPQESEEPQQDVDGDDDAPALETSDVVAAAARDTTRTRTRTPISEPKPTAAPVRAYRKRGSALDIEKRVSTRSLGTVEIHDDIERILKMKRAKKREERRRLGSMAPSEVTSEAPSEADMETELAHEYQTEPVQPKKAVLEPELKAKDPAEHEVEEAMSAQEEEKTADKDVETRLQAAESIVEKPMAQQAEVLRMDLDSSQSSTPDLVLMDATDDETEEEDFSRLNLRARNAVRESSHPAASRRQNASPLKRSQPSTLTRTRKGSEDNQSVRNLGPVGTRLNGKRTRLRSGSTTSSSAAVPAATAANTAPPTVVRSNFFDAALEAIEKKRRDAIARKKAAVAASAASVAATTVAVTSQDGA